MAEVAYNNNVTLHSLEKADSKLIEKRGEGTRYALITAGLELFGEYGLAGTSTRMLCKHAGANISAIPYYFGGKEGLYIAVIEYIVARVSEYTADAHAHIRHLLSQKTISKKQAREAVLIMTRSFAHMFVASEEPRSWARIVMREQFRPTNGFDILYNAMMKEPQAALGKLIAICIDADPESDEVKMRAHCFLGQVLGFLTSRESILRHVGVRKLQDNHIDLIHDVLAAHVQACLSVRSLEGGS